MLLDAGNGGGWTAVIVMLSIFVPLTVTIALVVWWIRRTGDDPDAERLKRVQQEWERNRRGS